VQPDHLTQAGFVKKIHGYKGEVCIHWNSGIIPLFKSEEPVFVEFEQIPVPFFIHNVRPINPGQHIISFDDVDSDIKAATLSGKKVFLCKSNFVLEQQEFLPDEILIGYEVFDVNLGALGILCEINRSSPQPLMVVDSSRGEILIPFVREFIVGIEEKDKRIVVRTPEGLTDINIVS
jgi:16S rRNA processing protein RimM